MVTRPTSGHNAVRGRRRAPRPESRTPAKSWQSLNAGLTVLDVKTLALDATGETLYAGIAGGVVSVHPKR